MKTIELDEIDWEIICHPEDVPVQGNAIVSGDYAFDKGVEDEILKELEWNQWAWCTIEVKGTYGDILNVSEYLGCCSYENEEEFKTGGCYEDMKEQVKKELQEKLITFFNYMERKTKCHS